MYTHELPIEALSFIDEHMNGEDLLFNYMVANATGMGPIGKQGFGVPVLPFRPLTVPPRRHCCEQSSKRGPHPYRIRTTLGSGVARVIWLRGRKPCGCSTASLAEIRSNIRHREAAAFWS
jgi:hypothetical protein